MSNLKFLRCKFWPLSHCPIYQHWEGFGMCIAHHGSKHTASPAWLPGATSTLPKTPCQHARGHQPLLQLRRSRAGLQLPTALPCVAMGPLSQAHLQAHHPSQPQSSPSTREVPDPRGWGCWEAVDVDYISWTHAMLVAAYFLYLWPEFTSSVKQLPLTPTSCLW